MYYVYLIRCADNSLYCGITNDLEKRLKEHNSTGPRGAKYTRSKRPVALVFSETHEDKISAMKREIEIKSWPKSKKELLIKS
jgi:putative endonuclease